MDHLQFCLTFLNVSMSMGLPFGNDTNLGHNWLSLLITKQIAADTTHWNQVTNKGASKSLLNNALFTNTVTMDVTLESKVIIGFVCQSIYSIQTFTNMPLQQELCECISTPNFQAAVENTFLTTCCTRRRIIILDLALEIAIIWSFHWLESCLHSTVMVLVLFWFLFYFLTFYVTSTRKCGAHRHSDKKYDRYEPSWGEYTRNIPRHFKRVQKMYIKLSLKYACTSCNQIHVNLCLIYYW